MGAGGATGLLGREHVQRRPPGPERPGSSPHLSLLVGHRDGLWSFCWIRDKSFLSMADIYSRPFAYWLCLFFVWMVAYYAFAAAMR